MEALDDSQLPLDAATDLSIIEVHPGDVTARAAHLHLVEEGYIPPAPAVVEAPEIADPFTSRSPWEATNPNGTW